MAIIKIDVYDEYLLMYKKARHPLGKSKRGFKKWLKKLIIQTLTTIARNESYK